MNVNHALVEIVGVSKRFGGAYALADLSLVIRKGSIHGLVGENGAGKSTLGKILSGLVAPDAGEVRVDGEQVAFASPRAALARGITAITQELALVPRRTVLENVYLGRERGRGGLVSERRLARRYRQLQEATGFDELLPDVLVGDLRVADQQKVEIRRAIERDARLIVFDEPTAALSEDESSQLFEVVRSLQRAGKTIVYISHFLREVLDLADTVTVLKDGRLVRTSPSAEETPASLVTAMLGRSMDVVFPAKQPPADDAPVVFEARDLHREPKVSGVSFEVRRGEILGMAGLVGSGRSEVARAIFGADPLDSGSVWVGGSKVRLRSPRDAIAKGIAMLPESRKDQGLFLTRSIAENVSLPFLADVSRAGVISRRRERAGLETLLDSVGVRGPNSSFPVQALSGGNQQKTMFAKWLYRPPHVLIADEPTRGIDVGAKLTIYELLTRLAEEGMAVIVISSDLEEVLGLAHRIVVMREGAIVAHLPGDAEEADVMSAAFAAHETIEEAHA
jgi:ABC-type sugar transport system ATPase subunit